MSNKVTKNDVIFKLKSPWDNPYQGSDKKVLFVCSAGILRSATAARIYAKKYNTRAAGTGGLDYTPLIPVTSDLLVWANEVVFVNAENYSRCCSQFDLDTFDCKITVLDIPDNYDHMNPDLIKAFEEQYEYLD